MTAPSPPHDDNIPEADPRPTPPGEKTTTPSAAIPEDHIPPLPHELGPSFERTRPTIPGYEILGELGRGGMGVVFKARHEALGRVVAVKMILAGGYASEADLARFRREANAIARLQHANIVQVFEIGEHEGFPFFSLEFCPGGALDKQLAGTPVPPAEAAKLVETLARAMQAVHDQQVIHRDLKPANILLTADGTPKITDFGLARKLDESGQTASGTIMGTPSYMAPEQASGNVKEIGPAADIYALGAILYEMLTGRPPFRGMGAETLVQVITEEPTPPRQIQPKLPRDLETIVLKCLKKKPGERYGSAKELAEQLRWFLDGKPISDRPARRMLRVRPALRSIPRAVIFGLILGVGLGIAGLAAAIAIFAILWINPPKPIRPVQTEASNETLHDQREPETLLVQREPDLQITEEAPKKIGRVAVHTRPELYERFVARRTAISLVLDFSGSMNDKGPDGRTRRQRAVLALRQVLEELPLDVYVSLRAFGASDFFKEDPKSPYVKFGCIKLIHPSEPWDRGRINAWMTKIDQLTPEYGTPLVRTICMALNDFPKDFKGKRSVVVLTDGADSNFYSGKLDQDLKARFGETIADVLNGAFAKASGLVDGDDSAKEIQLHVVGFEISEKEKNERSYPDFVKALKGREKKGTGKYYDAQDTANLALSLRLSLLPTYFGVADDADGFVRDFSTRGNSITTIDDRINRINIRQNLRSASLPESSYRVFIPTLPTLRQSIAIRPGDYLLLELLDKKPVMAFRHSMFANMCKRGDLGFAELAPELSDSWQLAALQNMQIRGDPKLQIMMTLEKEQKIAGINDQIRVIRPPWTWFEVSGSERAGEAPPSMKVNTVWDYPAPAWQLNLPWPTHGNEVTDPPPTSSVKAWWIARNPPVAGSLLGWNQQKWVDRPWPTESKAHKVLIESIKKETMELEIRPSSAPVERPCLVVRLKYPPPKGDGKQEAYYAQLLNWEGGQQHRFYNHEGESTSIFFLKNSDEIDQLPELQLISVAECKAAALTVPKLVLGIPNEKNAP